MASPNPLHTMIGAGAVKWKMTKPTADADYRDIGETSAFTVSVTTERKQFRSKRTSARRVVRSEVTDQAASIGITFNEMSPENLALQMLGTVAAPSGGPYYTIDMLAAAAVEGYIRFVGATEIGDKVQVDALINVQPSGEVDFLTDDWAGAELTGEVTEDDTFGMGRILHGIEEEVT